jgi:hypothetical protein
MSIKFHIKNVYLGSSDIPSFTKEKGDHPEGSPKVTKIASMEELKQFLKEKIGIPAGEMCIHEALIKALKDLIAYDDIEKGDLLILLGAMLHEDWRKIRKMVFIPVGSEGGFTSEAGIKHAREYLQIQDKIDGLKKKAGL